MQPTAGAQETISGSKSRSGQGHIRVLHRPKVIGHSDTESPADCVKCGEALADILCKQLRVGLETEARFQFRDVTILLRHTKIKYGSGLIQGLRQASIPLHIVDQHDSSVATASEAANELLILSDSLPHHVDATRKVVVILQPTYFSSVSEDDVASLLKSEAQHLIYVSPKPQCSEDDHGDKGILDQIFEDSGLGNNSGDRARDGERRRRGSSNSTCSCDYDGCFCGDCDCDCDDCVLM